MAENITTLKGIEQGRAEFAFQKAQDGSKLSDKQRKEYKSYAKKIPMMIKTNGLGATLAYLGSKAKNKKGEKTAYGFLLDHIFAWLKEKPKPMFPGVATLKGSLDLPGFVVGLESSPYRALTVEILAYVNWLQRFAEGLIEGEATNGD